MLLVVIHVVLQEPLHHSRFVVSPVALHVVLHVPTTGTATLFTFRELLHPSRFVVFPVEPHVVLHAFQQELLHPSRFVVFSAVLL